MIEKDCWLCDESLQFHQRYDYLERVFSYYKLWYQLDPKVYPFLQSIDLQEGLPKLKELTEVIGLLKEAFERRIQNGTMDNGRLQDLIEEIKSSRVIEAYKQFTVCLSVKTRCLSFHEYRFKPKMDEIRQNYEQIRVRRLQVFL
mmetsp:Transcript_7653/g.8647  ORF Transcript_7653/g.8647 Transcript_7653/m.8647 type:complete len:144 (-) Transcript_7653:814-1245(-)